MTNLDRQNDRALGYEYPAGAEHDPDAPWNARDQEDDSPSRYEIECEKADRARDEDKDREAEERE